MSTPVTLSDSSAAPTTLYSGAELAAITIHNLETANDKVCRLKVNGSIVPERTIGPGRQVIRFKGAGAKLIEAYSDTGKAASVIFCATE